MPPTERDGTLEVANRGPCSSGYHWLGWNGPTLFRPFSTTLEYIAHVEPAVLDSPGHDPYP